MGTAGSMRDTLPWAMQEKQGEIPRPQPRDIDKSPMGSAQPSPFGGQEVIRLHRRILSLENRLREWEERMGFGQTVVTTLGSPRWEIGRPLSVTIEQRGNEDFVACLYDHDLYGYGDSIPDALDDLKASIVNQFEYLIERDDEELGDSLLRQLDFLRSIMVRRDVGREGH